MAVSARRQLVNLKDEQWHCDADHISLKGACATPKVQKCQEGNLYVFHAGAAEGDSRPHKTQAQPLFLVATGSDTVLPVSGEMPVWRSIAANLAAGATAGCAVEAGVHLSP